MRRSCRAGTTRPAHPLHQASTSGAAHDGPRHPHAPRSLDTPTNPRSLCLDRFLNATADLVFVEFIANDGSEMDTQLRGPQDKTRSFERFLRKIQSQPESPAVVMMQVQALCLGGQRPGVGTALRGLPQGTA